MDDCSSVENLKFACAQEKPDVRFTTWVTGDPHVYSFEKSYQMCLFNEKTINCFENEFLSIYCKDKLINSNASFLSEIRLVFRYNKDELTFLAEENTFSEQFSSNKYNDSKVVYSQDDLNKKLIEVRSESADNRVIFDYKQAVTITITRRQGKFFSLVVRGSLDFYSFKSSGLLVDGCGTNNQSLELFTRRSNSDSFCVSECNSIAGSFNGSISLNRKDVLDVCLFDCEINSTFVYFISDTVQVVHKSQAIYDLIFKEEPPSTSTPVSSSDFTSTTTSSPEITTSKNSEAIKLNINFVLLSFSFLISFKFILNYFLL